MIGHVYQCPALPDRGLVLIHGDIYQTWLPGTPVVPGSIWCWRHNGWEDIPPHWRAREELLRFRIIIEWNTTAQHDPHTGPVITDLITRYCHNNGWLLPDLDDRCAVMAFVTAMKDRTRLM